MLPKFRPAILGAQRPPTRPIIRAVKPVAPLPPPAPPRRMPSGLDYATPSTPPMGAGELSDLFEASTESLEGPPTTRRASDPVLDSGTAETFDDETRVRGDETRVHADEETHLRQDGRFDDYECETQRNDSRRDSFPSTRREVVTPAVDTERSFAGDDAGDERYVDARRTFESTTADEQPSYRMRGDRATAVPRTYLSPPPVFDPLEDSGARALPFDRASAASNDHRPLYDSINAAKPLLPLEPIASTTVPDRTSGASVAHLPHDVRPHVAGLMPTQLSAPMPQERVQAYAAPPQYSTFPMPQAILSGSGVGSFDPAPIHYRAPQPTAPRLATARSDRSVAAKVGRFAWFVFGAAFGLFFAFFATGFVSPRISAKSEAPVQATAHPAAVAPPATVAAAPAQTMVPAQTAAMPTVAPSQLAPAQPTAFAQPAPPAMAAPVMAAPTQPVFQATPAVLAAPPVAAAPRSRPHVHRPAAPKPAAAPAESDDDDDGLGPSPRTRTKSKPADVGDLLNAGIAP